MKKLFRNFFKNKYFVAVIMMNILFFISNSYLIFSLFKLSNIEDMLRILMIIFLFLFFTLSIIKTIKVYKSKSKIKSIVFSILLLIVFVLESLIYNTIDKVYSSIDSISSNTTKYSSSLVVLKTSNLNNIKDIKNKKIGLYNNKESIESYILPNEIIDDKKLDNNNEIIEYENLADLVSDLYSKKIDAIFASSNYYILFSYNGYSNIKEETLVLASKDKVIKNKENTKQEISEPFTILLMGVDSTLDSIKSGSAFNGDALMLITFNPNTLNATMLSIPRDTYVPITCFKNKRENKITHAAWYGEECMIDTIENFTKVNIDYYAKINFKGLVKLVDNLEGIYVDVPYSLCEQDSDRNWGKNTIYLEKGYRKINGEQALALARNRHKPNDGSDIGRQMANYCPSYKEGSRDDLERGQNQQMIINGILNSVKNINKLDDLYALLDLMSESIETNINTNQILSLYNIAKKMLLNNSTLAFDSLYLLGYDTLIWDDSFKMQLYNYYYNRQSLQDIVKAMNVNLEKEDPTLIKEIHFSINKPYEKVVIGKGPYKNEQIVNLLPNFKDKNIEYVNNWGKSNNIKIVIKYVDVSLEKENDLVVSQSIPFGYIVSNINKDLEITVGKYTPKTLEEDLSKIPDFNTYSIEEANNWKNKIKEDINILIEIIKKDDADYDLEKAGKLHSQSVVAGKNISDVSEIKIIFYEKEKEL